MGGSALPEPQRAQLQQIVGFTADQVIESLAKDSTLVRSTDLTMQVHSIDPPHPFILRSIELMAEKVAPALGWVRSDTGNVRRVA